MNVVQGVFIFIYISKSFAFSLQFNKQVLVRLAITLF